ncbi:winged helix-turn-helix transcriptional regulator [Georgenia deserti]|uniref:Winged helix-turn-helix transcriptional regulator n=1 Tax=Georgenia deserti TaxID=2093781 RepID=A0ABW4L4M0_9MICO
MAGKRWYDDSCGMAQGLNFVGDRWALHVVRELLLGPKRFADLRADLPRISSNVLTQRLTELEERGVLRRRRLPAPASVWVYDLTDWGAELEPIIRQLGHWAARSPHFDRSSPLSCTSAVLSMRTMFRPGQAEGVSVRIGFRLGDLTLDGRILGGEFAIQAVDRLFGPGEDGGPDAVVTAAPEVLAGVIFRGLDLDEVLESGALVLEGDRAAFERYRDCFSLPETAPIG